MRTSINLCASRPHPHTLICTLNLSPTLILTPPPMPLTFTCFAVETFTCFEIFFLFIDDPDFRTLFLFAADLEALDTSGGLEPTERIRRLRVTGRVRGTDRSSSSLLRHINTSEKGREFMRGLMWRKPKLRHKHEHRPNMQARTYRHRC